MISILIPTMNRSEYVSRALRYYATTGFKGQVLIGDSSNEQHVTRTRQDIDALAGRLNISYRYFPNPPYKGNAVVLKELADMATTPYVVYAGDDDFVIPVTLERCAKYLDGHPSYGAAHGASVTVVLKAGGAHGEIAYAYNMIGHILESESARTRWLGYIRHALSTQYYLHRVEVWRRMYRDVPSVPLRYLGEEVLPCSLTTIMGKVQEVAGLSCVFQVNQVKEFGWGTHSMYTLMMDPNWSTAALRLREVIAGALVEQDHISMEEATRAFDKEWWRHVLIMAQSHYDTQHDEPSNLFSAFKKRYPAIVTLNKMLREMRQGRHKRLSLETLLTPSSPLHADFMPVYQAITGAGAPTA